MTELEVYELLARGFYLLLLISLPPIIVAVFFGLSVSLIQSLTQVQEQSLGFLLKYVSVIFVSLLVLQIYGQDYLLFAEGLLKEIPLIVR